MRVRKCSDGQEWGWLTRAINLSWEDFEEGGWSLACRQVSEALPAFVPDSARLRRCGDWMRPTVRPSCAASDRRSLGLAKPGRLANHRAASIGGRRWPGP